MDTAHLAEAVSKGERRAVGRLITLLESEDAKGEETLHLLQGAAGRKAGAGRAHVIGITGAPGTGKSTLVDRLIEALRRDGKRVGVVAVDPSSPFTGGAILGDRIRMQTRSTDPGVFIRSMGSRGALGGLSAHTADAVRVLDASGCDYVLVETVGVGQAEVDVVRLADTVVVVLVPNLGDDVQSVKAGIMEIADLFVVNKADLAGSDKVAGEVEASLQLAHGTGWDPPILRTVAERGEGTAEVLKAVAAHREWAESSGAWAERRRRRMHDEVRLLLQREAAGWAFARDGRPRKELEGLFAKLEGGESTPRQAVRAILEKSPGFKSL